MKELLFSVTKKDFEFQVFKSSGAGGQHRNKVSTAMRCTHKESGAVATCTEHKSQVQNKRVAFKRCCETVEFKKWLWLKIEAIKEKKTVEQMLKAKVDKAISEENLKVEVMKNGEWIKLNS